MDETFIETIYDNAMAAAAYGENVNINLLTKTVKIGNQVVINNGKYEGELGIDLSAYETSEQLLSYLEELYERYKHSVPSEKETSRRNYFYALKEKDMSDEDMMFGESRNRARVDLELTFLAMTLTGALTWDDSWGTYFWQSKKDRDFAILRSWF